MMRRMSEGDGHRGYTEQSARVGPPHAPFPLAAGAAVLLAWASWRYSEALGDPALKLHRWNGHAILVLVVWRLLWGLFGSSTSRFSAWLWWPWTAAVYGMRLLRGQTPLYLSHNPLGSYMILAAARRRDGAGGVGPLHRRAQRPHRRPALPPDLRGERRSASPGGTPRSSTGGSWGWCRSTSSPTSGTASPRRSR